MKIYNWHVILKQDYKGFQIVRKRQVLGGGYTDYFCIYKDREQYSILCLNSEKAAQNVIDTHIRHLKEGGIKQSA